MKYLLIIAGIFLVEFCQAQERKLKEVQPTPQQLMLFVIPLNPADTIFSDVDFSYLPVKGFPYFIVDYKTQFYTITQRDSIIRKVDAMFFEE